MCLLLSTACTKGGSSFQRVAILPIANLTANPGLDWIGDVLPFVVAEQVAGSPDYHVIAAESDSNARALRATAILRGDFDNRGLLLMLFDTRTNKVRRSTRLALDQKSPADTATRVGQWLTGVATPLKVSPAALEAFGRSLRPASGESALELVDKALAADPGFALAAQRKALLLISSQKLPEARKLLDDTAASASGWSRLQLQIAAGNLAGADTIPLLEQAVKAAPANTDLLRTLSDRYQARHNYAAAAAALNRALQLDSDFAPAWNGLAYLQAYQHQYDEALRSIEKYRSLTPQDPNTFDSYGEIQFMAGRFQDAEKSFLAAQQMDAGFLGAIEFSKAAFARFLSGDRAGADAIFQRYLESRRALKDPMADLRHAHWLLMTGRRDQGIAELNRLAQTTAPAAAPAKMFLEVASGGTGTNLPENLRRMTETLRLVIAGQGAAVRPQLEQLFRQTPPSSNDDVRIALGAARLAAGDGKGAWQMLRNYPIPPRPGETILATLWFPRYPEWRAQASR